MKLAPHNVRGMISRPNFQVVVAVLAGLLLLVALVFGPSAAFIWQSIDPLGYAASHIASATRFVGPGETDTGRLEPPLDSWRSIARSRVADSVFDALTGTPAYAPRLYAIAGIALRDSLRASRLASGLANESANISTRLHPCDPIEHRSVREMADSVRSPSFARFLLTGDSVARCRPDGT